MHKQKMLGIIGLATNLYSAYTGYMDAHHEYESQHNAVCAVSALVCILLIAKTLYDMQQQVVSNKKNLLHAKNKLFHLTKHLLNETYGLMLIGSNAATHNTTKHLASIYDSKSP